MELAWRGIRRRRRAMPGQGLFFLGGGDDGFEEIEESVVLGLGLGKAGWNGGAEMLDECGDGPVHDSHTATTAGGLAAGLGGEGGIGGVGVEAMQGAIRGGELDDLFLAPGAGLAEGAVRCSTGALGDDFLVDDSQGEDGALGDVVKAGGVAFEAGEAGQMLKGHG